MKTMSGVVRASRPILVRLRELTIAWHETLVFFTYDPRQGDGALDGRVRVFGGRDRVPARVAREFVASRGRALWLLIRLRMLLRNATLVYLAEDGRLRAYGLIRRCDPLPRRYRWLVPRGVILGPYWTAPASRGQGLYPILLRASIALSTDREHMPLIVYADASNSPSIRGLEKAGFARLGTYNVTSRLLFLLHIHEPVSVVSTIADVWTRAQPGRSGPDGRSLPPREPPAGRQGRLRAPTIAWSDARGALRTPRLLWAVPRAVAWVVIGLWEFVVVRRESLAFFTYDPRQGNEIIDPRIRVVGGRSKASAATHEAFARTRGLPLWLLIRLHMVLRDATLVYIAGSGRVCAYGLMRRCDPLPRRYRWLARRSVVLGPAWTEPALRGRGLHGRILRARIALCNDRREMPIITFTDVSNSAAIRGFEKVGMIRLGSYTVTSGLFGMWCTHTTIAENSTIAKVWAGL
jgi:RimJ/RimL family protein N-acetyltransferase